MSSGLPVIAARAGGIPELIQDGVSGYLFDDEGEAIATVQQLLRSPGLMTSVKENARESALGHSWKAATERLVEHYQCARECVMRT